MKKHFLWILLLSSFLVSCQLFTPTNQDEILAQTIAARAEEQLASTPSQVPPTITATELPTETPTTEPTATNTPTPEPTSTPDFIAGYPIEGYGPSNFPSNVNPLTGLPVGQPALLERRPISIKISNFPRGIRPQWGLSLADHVYEYYHEGGLTRFNAIFYSNNVAQIGPIRSARFSDKDIVEMYKAFFAYASADVLVRERLSYTNFTDRMATITDYPCPPTTSYPLCRIEQETWNHLVTKTEELYQHFENKGVTNDRQNLDGLLFKLDLPPNGQSASSVIVRYSYGSYHLWEYEPLQGKYFRNQDVVDIEAGQEIFEPTLDRLNGQPISADNVVVILAPYQYFSVDPEMLEIPFNGYGKGYVFREGHVFSVNWGRMVDSELIFLTDDTGNRFALKPGNTWFVVIGSTSQVRSESPDWRFQFSIP